MLWNHEQVITLREPRFYMSYEEWRKQTRSVRDTIGVY